MPLWSIRRGTAATATDGTTARSLEPVLEPLDLYLEGEVLLAKIDAQGERVTELLNAQPVLRVRLRDYGEWTSVDREEILLVAPPPHAGVRHRRLHRLKRPIVAEVGPYVVEGMAYLPPGSWLDSWVVNRPAPFLPITNVSVRWEGGQRDLPVAIVNTRRIVTIRELVGTV